MPILKLAHWKVRFSAMVTILLCAAIGPVARENGLDRGHDLRVNRRACDSTCASGLGAQCPSAYHKNAEAPESSPDANAGGSWHLQCNSGWCSDPESGHDCDLEGFETLEPLSTAVQQGDLRTLVSLLVSEPLLVVLNKDRRAFQLKNCAGQVAVHLPVSANLVADVESAMAGLRR